MTEPDRRPPPPADSRPRLLAGRGLVGTLGWLGTVVFALVAIGAAIRRGHGWPAALLPTALALAYTGLPWINAASARAQARRRRDRDGTLTIDDWGVTRTAENLRETVAWKELCWVRIYTTSDGPAAEDFFFALGGADGKGCLVPNGLAVTSNLLAALQVRLPGLDNEAVARAAGSVTEACFTIWTRPDPPSDPPKRADGG